MYMCCTNCNGMAEWLGSTSHKYCMHAILPTQTGFNSARSGLEDINQSKDIWISALKNNRCQSGC